METLSLAAQPRTLTGRRAKRVRTAGQIPAVVYGRTFPSMPVSVSASDFLRIYREAGESTLVELSIEGQDAAVHTLIQDVAAHPLTGDPIHIDFHQIAMDEEVSTRIPLEFVGIAPAVKAGGILVKQFDHLDVRALPAALVSEITVDVSSLATFDDLIRMRDLTVPEGITVEHDPDEVVISVTEQAAEEETPAPVAAEEAGTGAPVAGAPSDAKAMSGAPPDKDKEKKRE